MSQILSYTFTWFELLLAVSCVTIVAGVVVMGIAAALIMMGVV